ncbi:MAG: DCC1-like thiol-disulfide oxidoreductase family protein [Saprospiraceae bacterium]|nr:DCC1-like thiol-disulfide oxidoreductase family protein [Saprospiraceae bacterium]
MSNDNPIIAFDGVCNLCNGFIQWLIKRDKKKQFRYTTLQSDAGETLSHSIEVDGDSVLLFHKEKMYALSDVGLKCMRILGGVWTPLSWLIYLPKALRDMVYKFIAKNRYNWFGKADACMVPDASIRALFL